MLRTTQSAENLSLSMVEDAEVGRISSSDDCEDKMVKRSLFTSKNLNKTTSYLMPDTKQAFIQLRQVFTKTPILQHFDPECHIWIETDESSYAIGGVLS